VVHKLKIFEFVRTVDCYPNISIAYWILLTMVILHKKKKSF